MMIRIDLERARTARTIVARLQLAMKEHWQVAFPLYEDAERARLLCLQNGGGNRNFTHPRLLQMWRDLQKESQMNVTITFFDLNRHYAKLVEAAFRADLADFFATCTADERTALPVLNVFNYICPKHWQLQIDGVQWGSVYARTEVPELPVDALFACNREATMEPVWADQAIAWLEYRLHHCNQLSEVSKVIKSTFSKIKKRLYLTYQLTELYEAYRVILDALPKLARAERLLKMYRLEFAQLLAIHFEEECAQPLANFNQSIETNILDIQVLTALHEEIAFDGFAWLGRWRQETRTSSVIHQRKCKWFDQCNELFQAHDGQYKPWMREIFCKLAIEFHARMQHRQMEQLFEWNKSVRYWNVMDRLIVFYDWHELVTRDTSYLFDVAERMTFIGRFERVVRNYFRHLREDDISEQDMVERFQNQYIVPRQFMRYDTWIREVDKLIGNERWMSRFSEATQLDLRFAVLKSHTLLSFFQTPLDERFAELQQQIEQRYGRMDRRWIELMTDIYPKIADRLKRADQYGLLILNSIEEDNHDNLGDRLQVIATLLERKTILLNQSTILSLAHEYVEIVALTKKKDLTGLCKLIWSRGARTLYFYLMQRQLETYAAMDNKNVLDAMRFYGNCILLNEDIFRTATLFTKASDYSFACFRMVEQIVIQKATFDMSHLSFLAKLLVMCSQSNDSRTPSIMQNLYEYVLNGIEEVQKQDKSLSEKWRNRFFKILRNKDWHIWVEKHGGEQMWWDWLEFSWSETKNWYLKTLKDVMIVSRLNTLKKFETRFSLDAGRLAAVAEMRARCYDLLGPHHPKVKGGM